MNNILHTQDTHFTYPDGTYALRGIDFCARKGEFIGILGGNGCGKTTFLKILNGLLKPSKGDAYLETENLKFMDRDKLFRRVCTCFQDPDDQLFSSTVAEDIAFGPKNMGLTKEEVQTRVDYSLSCVGMSEFAHKTIHTLSYGQKKKVCLAGVLAMGPQVILLDEPTASLDPKGVSSIMRLLKGINVKNGVTMVMATHSVDLIPLFIDRAIILDKGKIVKEGSAREIFTDAEMLRSANLRLTRIGHLFEILKKKDGLNIEGLPLTIGEARREIKTLYEFRQLNRT